MEKIAIRQDIKIEDARLLVIEIPSIVENLLDQFSEEDRELLEYKKYISEKRKLEYLGTRWGLKYLTGSLEVIYDFKGKPMLKNGNYQISISHSSRWVAVMAHPTRRIGVDIEKRSNKILSVFSRFLSEEEQQVLYNGETDLRKLQIAWSAKETIYKIVGQEAVDFASQLRVLDFQIAPNGNMTVEHIPSNTSYNLIYTQSAEYTLVYCTA
jgi:4'-phosphopantetheinyl transferase